MAEDIEQFSFATDLPRFLNDILDKTPHLCNIPFEMESLEQHAVTLDQTISLLRVLEDTCHVGDDDITQFQELSSVFVELLQAWKRLLPLASITTTTLADLGSKRQANTSSPGRPSYNISSETLEELRGPGFTWGKIPKILGVSRWTVRRRV